MIVFNKTDILISGSFVSGAAILFAGLSASVAGNLSAAIISGATAFAGVGTYFYFKKVENLNLVVKSPQNESASRPWYTTPEGKAGLAFVSTAITGVLAYNCIPQLGNGDVTEQDKAVCASIYKDNTAYGELGSSSGVGGDLSGSDSDSDKIIKELKKRYLELDLIYD